MYICIPCPLLDIDGDGVISRRDMSDMLDLMTDRSMEDKIKDVVIDGVGSACDALNLQLVHVCVNLQIFSEVNKEANCDGLSTEDFQYAISRSPDFARYKTHTHTQN